MNKGVQIVRIILWALLGLVLLAILIGALAGGLSSGFFRGGSLENYTPVAQDVFDPSRVKSVQAEWTSGKLDIKKAEDGQIKVVQWGGENFPMEEKYRLQLNDDGVLTVKQGRPKRFLFIFSFSLRNDYVQIFLPEKLYDEIDVKVTSGNVTVEDIRCNDMEIKLTSGNIYANRLSAEEMDLQLTSGKIEGVSLTASHLQTKLTSGKILTQGQFKNINAQSTSGKFEIKSGIVPDTIDARLTSGNGLVTIPENDGFAVASKVTSGKFSTDFDILYRDTDSKYRSGSYLNNTSRNYNFQLTSGKLELKRAQ